MQRRLGGIDGTHARGMRVAHYEPVLRQSRHCVLESHSCVAFVCRTPACSFSYDNAGTAVGTGFQIPYATAAAANINAVTYNVGSNRFTVTNAGTYLIALQVDCTAAVPFFNLSLRSALSGFG